TERLRPIANTSPHEQTLFDANTLAVQLQPNHGLRRQPTGDNAALPSRERRAAVQHRARWSYHGRPRPYRCLEFRPCRVIRNLRAGIVVTVAHERPAVVAPALDEIELIAAEGAHLERPEPAGLIECRREDVPVTVAPDVAASSVGPDERIVGGDRSIR